MTNPTSSAAVTPLRQKTVQPIEISFVIPAYNEAENIADTISLVHVEATHLRLSHEILVVDDGSLDATCEIAVNAAHDLPVRVLRLSRNFGKEQAIMAGLWRATGAAVVILDADMQEPVSHLATMLKQEMSDEAELVSTWKEALSFRRGRGCATRQGRRFGST